LKFGPLVWTCKLTNCGLGIWIKVIHDYLKSTRSDASI